jgi:hypothetical protein
MASISDVERPTTPSQFLHFTLVGACVSAIIFVACWLLAFTPISATHAIIALFTAADTTSQIALVQGTCWSFIFGAWVGFLIAAVHKAAARLGL